MPVHRPHPVRMGQLLVRRAAEAPGGLSICGLGSCVAVFLHEAGHGLGGMAHVLLPEPGRRSPLTSPGAFAPTAVVGLIDQILQRGGRRERLRAKVVGGAHLFAAAAGCRETLGQRNVRATLAALRREAIPVAGMDVGGSCGRTVVADIATGLVRVTSLRREGRQI